MNKLLKTSMVGVLLFSSISKADLMENLKDYGLPCAVSFAAGLLASKDHGGAIGLSACLGIGTSTYLQSEKKAQKMRDEDFKKFLKMMDDHSVKVFSEQDAKVEKAIKELQEKQENQIEAVRQIMKEVIAERMTLVSDEVKSDIKRYIERADFMQDLEKKVMIKMKEEVKVETGLQKKEIVSQCVDDALNQLVLKKVGTPQQQE